MVIDVQVQAVVPSQFRTVPLWRQAQPWQHGFAGEQAWPPWPQVVVAVWHTPLVDPGAVTQDSPEQQSALLVHTWPEP